MAFAVGVGARGDLAAGLRARVSPRRCAALRRPRAPRSRLASSFLVTAPRHVTHHSASPSTPPPPLRRRPSRPAPRSPAASPPRATAFAAASSPLSAPPADAPLDPLAALSGVSVVRASDGAIVDAATVALAPTAPGRPVVAYFMRSFG